MTILANYNAFDGRHWETGSVANHWKQRGVTAPHTGAPYSEALLLGVSGGVVMGYFTFAYAGTDPQCNILTRNTFDPLDTLLTRLGAVQHFANTAKPEKAQALLLDALQDGAAPLVWADMWHLPYNGLDPDEGMWGNFPVVVFGVDESAETVHIADRAAVPLTVTTSELAQARGRTKKHKHRLLTLDPPNPDKLASAVRLGIDGTLKLYTEKPPKGSKNNFGLQAYRHWAKLLTQPKQRQSWYKLFPRGRDLWAGLSSAFEFGLLFGKGTALDGERGVYGDFLQEAAALLDNAALLDAAPLFRQAGAAWGRLASALLPDDVPLLGETRRLMAERHALFLAEGNGSLRERQALSARLKEIRAAVSAEFPLSPTELTPFYENVAAHVIAIHDVETAAVDALAAAMG